MPSPTSNRYNMPLDRFLQFLYFRPNNHQRKLPDITYLVYFCISKRKSPLKDNFHKFFQAR